MNVRFCFLTSGFLTWFAAAVLIEADPTEHWNQRRLLNPAFTVPAIRDLIPIFDAQADVLTEKWLKFSATGQMVPTHADLTRMTVVRT